MFSLLHVFQCITSWVLTHSNWEGKQLATWHWCNYSFLTYMQNVTELQVSVWLVRVGWYQQRWWYVQISKITILEFLWPSYMKLDFIEFSFVSISLIGTWIVHDCVFHGLIVYTPWNGKISLTFQKISKSFQEWIAKVFTTDVFFILVNVIFNNTPLWHKLDNER